MFPRIYWLCAVVLLEELTGSFAKSDDLPHEGSSEQSDGTEQTVQKKSVDETVPYVVQVGEQEEDLDYDLKTETDEVVENFDHIETENFLHGSSKLLEKETDQSRFVDSLVVFE